MDAFGDVSGTFRNLLNSDSECEVVAVAVVIGDKIAAARCPKQTVRNITDVDEAKWTELMDHQKRRVIECLADNEHLRFGYVTFTFDQLDSLKYSYLLFQNVEFPPAWDIVLTGYAYGEILFKADAESEHQVVFHPDRMASVPQTKTLREYVETFVSVDHMYIERSHDAHGIQAADCIAGAIRETHIGRYDWLDYFNTDELIEASPTALIQLESELDDYR